MKVILFKLYKPAAILQQCRHFGKMKWFTLTLKKCFSSVENAPPMGQRGEIRSFAMLSTFCVKNQVSEIWNFLLFSERPFYSEFRGTVGLRFQLNKSARWVSDWSREAIWQCSRKCTWNSNITSKYIIFSWRPSKIMNISFWRKSSIVSQKLPCGTPEWSREIPRFRI